MEKALGLMIEMFENEDPIPKPLPEWNDVDNIQRLFNIYFLGHLCKMLNIKNRYSQLYEYGQEKSGYFYDYASSDKFTSPRPFTENTVQEIKNSKLHIDALKQGIKRNKIKTWR